MGHSLARHAFSPVTQANGEEDCVMSLKNVCVGGEFSYVLLLLIPCFYYFFYIRLKNN